MFTRLFSLLCFVLLLILTSVTFGMQLGDFENNMDGWNPIEPNAITSFSTIGATLNQNSLRIETTLDGNQDVLVLDLAAIGLVDQFRENLKISADVTRLISEWTDQGGSWSDFFLVPSSLWRKNHSPVHSPLVKTGRPSPAFLQGSGRSQRTDHPGVG